MMLVIHWMPVLSWQGNKEYMKQPKVYVRPAYVTMWWFPFFVGGVVILGTLLVLVPQIKGIVSSKQTLDKLSADLEKAEKKITQVNALDANEIKTSTTLLTQALPGKAPYYEVLLLIQQLGGQTGVILGDFELKPGSLATGSAAKVQKPNKEGYLSMDTKLTVKGTTEQVSDFVIKLQESLPLVMIKGISISKDNVQAQEDVRSANLELQLLYMPELKLITEVDLTPLAPISSDLFQISNTLMTYFNPEAIAATQPASISDFSRTDLFNF